MAGQHPQVVATISKEAWAAVSGYSDSGRGSEDFGLCCRLVEYGLWGRPAGSVPLAAYLSQSDSVKDVAGDATSRDTEWPSVPGGSARVQ